MEVPAVQLSNDPRSQLKSEIQKSFRQRLAQVSSSVPKRGQSRPKEIAKLLQKRLPCRSFLEDNRAFSIISQLRSTPSSTKSPDQRAFSAHRREFLTPKQ